MKHSTIIAIISSALAGCTAFYSNSGSKTTVGDVSAPIEVSDSTDSMTCKLLYSLTGASVWTARDSIVTIDYVNTYTNSYIGMIDKVGQQTLSVTIDPKDNKSDSSSLEKRD